MRARVAAGVAYTRSRHRDPSPRRADRSTCDGPEQGAAGSVAGGQAAVSGAEQRDVHESSRYNALGRRRGNHARVSRAAGDEAGEVADEERRDQADDPRRAAAVPAQHTKQPSAERAVFPFFIFFFFHAPSGGDGGRATHFSGYIEGAPIIMTGGAAITMGAAAITTAIVLGGRWAVGACAGGQRCFPQWAAIGHGRPFPLGTWKGSKSTNYQ
eukprot:GHVR01189816.1.p1 GENE.GHVR01189816.1~~GHVR01189816.1.p1  ORF type:complete len:213 (+),score=34.61 GHVR01189816.1:71-709(+)